MISELEDLSEREEREQLYKAPDLKEARAFRDRVLDPETKLHDGFAEVRHLKAQLEACEGVEVPTK